MRAWAVDEPAPAAQHPLRFIERELGEPGEGELVARVRACGVCRTDLHLAEGDLRPRHRLVVPGHEVVAEVERLGTGCHIFSPGDRVGIPWLGSTCGACRYCTSGRENLCVRPTFTGWDRDGGYAEAIVAKEEYLYALPESLGDEQAAPLLCAGIIGFRALRRTELERGGVLGIYGFGGSAHLAAQVAIAEGASVHVFTRSERARRLALSLGAESAGGPHDPPPVPLDAAVIFAPSGEVVPVALAALVPSGRAVLAGIYMSALPSFSYGEHLFGEKSLTSVTANTRADGREFLDIAGRIGIEVTTTPYAFEEADRALSDLAAGQVAGAAVLQMS